MVACPDLDRVVNCRCRGAPIWARIWDLVRAVIRKVPRMSRRSARDVFQGSTSPDRRLLEPVMVLVLPPFPRLLCVDRRQTSYGLNEILIDLIPYTQHPGPQLQQQIYPVAPPLR